MVMLRNLRIAGNTEIFKLYDPSLDLRNYLDMEPVEDLSDLILPANGRQDAIEMKGLMLHLENEVREWISHLKQVVPFKWLQNRTKKGLNDTIEITNAQHTRQKNFKDLKSSKSAALLLAQAQTQSDESSHSRPTHSPIN